jgi:hypothetical protein
VTRLDGGARDVPGDLAADAAAGDVVTLDATADGPITD